MVYLSLTVKLPSLLLASKSDNDQLVAVQKFLTEFIRYANFRAYFHLSMFYFNSAWHAGGSQKPPISSLRNITQLMLDISEGLTT